jgi:hypothetical protein
MMRVSTIENPEKMAPATKYGGKMVECQPGRIAIAKSMPTIECTDTTSGAARPGEEDVELAVMVPVAAVAPPAERRSP